MSKELERQNGSRELATTGENPFTAYGNSVRQTAIIGKLLKFSKGDWTAGEDDEPIEDGTQFTANMDNLVIGWQRWWDNKPTDFVGGRVATGYQAPKRNELGDMDEDQWQSQEDGTSRDPWQKTNLLILQDSDGELYTFATSSTGGLNAIGELCKKYGAQMRQRPDDFPIIEIGQGSYKHDEYGKVKFPTFKIVGWEAKDDFASLDRDDRSDEVEDDQPELVAPPAAKQPPKATPAATQAARQTSKAPAKGKSKTRF